MKNRTGPFFGFFLSYLFSYYFKVLKEFLKPKIEKNALPLSNSTQKILRLVSSVAIAHVLVSHKVRLDEDGYAKLFSSLIVWRDPKEKTCSAMDGLLSYFPSTQWR